VDQGFFPQVLVADVTGNGIPDIVTANNLNNTVSVILSNGDGTFQAPLTSPAGVGLGFGLQVAAAHLHGDQAALDLVVANSGFAEAGSLGSLNLLVGNGDGTFQPPIILATGITPTAVVVGDFTGDGIPDLVVTNGFDQNQTNLLLFQGNGDGTFQAPVSFADGIAIDTSFDGGLAAADLNSDGNLDLIVAHGSPGGASILLGNGDGTFQAPVSIPTTPFGGSAAGLVVGHFHDPNTVDLAVADPSRSSVSVVLGNGDGTFQAPVDFSTGALSTPEALAVADFNNDDNLDIVAMNQHDQGVSVLLGNGDGTFQAPQIISLGSTPGAVAVGDLNGDGLPDVVTSHPPDPITTDPGFASVLLDAGDGATPLPGGFTGAVTTGVGVTEQSAPTDPSTVAISQFTNADGTLGLRVVTSGQADTVTITDDAQAGTTTVDANGQQEVFDLLFSHFDLQLHSEMDELTFLEAGTQATGGSLIGRHLDMRVDLGTGENHFTFNPAQADGEPADIEAHSNVNLNVVGHNGNDFVSLSFDDIAESRVNVNVHGIGGGTTPDAPGTVRDSITFGHAGSLAGIRNSSVDVNVALGKGDINFAFNDGIDLGHLPEVPDAAGFGPSTMSVTINDSARHKDADNLTLLTTGVVNTGSTLNFNTNLGGGNNSFNAVFDANTFRIDDDGGQFITGAHLGGAAHFNVQAGTGKDTISFRSIHQAHTIELSGLFDINILGGSGKDSIRNDFGGAGFTDDDPFELLATNRAFRLRIDGGTGDDLIKVNLANAPTATFDWDVAIVGGSGNNDITFIGTNPAGGTPTFGPSGSVFIDGGGDGTNPVDVFGNFPVEVVNANG
jgi:hypothetical protein